MKHKKCNHCETMEDSSKISLVILDIKSNYFCKKCGRLLTSRDIKKLNNRNYKGDEVMRLTKTDFKKFAKTHYELMKEFENESKQSYFDLEVIVIEHSPFKGEKVHKRLYISRWNSDQSAILSEKFSEKIGILSFASFRNHGGGFLKGSIAQEESLCHHSNLYNILEKCKPGYDARRDINKGLYQDELFHIPDVLFFDYEPGWKDYDKPKKPTHKFDILSISAPNKIIAKKRGLKDSEIYETMRRRISLILNTADYKLLDTLVVGAFGCGVFGNDFDEVLFAFQNEFGKGKFTHLKNLVISIPDWEMFKDAKSIFDLDGVKELKDIHNFYLTGVRFQ